MIPWKQERNPAGYQHHRWKWVALRGIQSALWRKINTLSTGRL